MLYFELGLNDEDYLTENEYRSFWRISRLIWHIKSFFGIVLKKKIDSKFVYVIPKINKRFLKKVKKILKVSGQKQVCISDELFFKEEFVNLIKSKDAFICDGNWVFKYMLENILDYIDEMVEQNFISKEIAFLVDDDYELVIEYIKLLSNRFKVITVVTNNIINFSKVSDRLLKNEGIDINLVNNYRKSLSKVDYIVNIDFAESEIRKYTIFNKSYFINFGNKYEIEDRRFEGLNITRAQIAIPDKYLKYAELFKNFNYLNAYESLIKKKTSILNILREIEKDDIEIIFLENENGMIKNEEFLGVVNKILDK